MTIQNSDLLPPKLRSGYVYDKILRAVADSTHDEDRFPDGLAAQGRVIFTPMHALLQLTEDGRGVKVTKEPVVCTISDGGYNPAEAGLLVDQSGSVGGVWLPVGRWTATYRFSDGMSSVPPVTFDVTEEHTKESPADLGLLAELVQPPRTKFVVNEQIYVDSKKARDEALEFRNDAQEAFEKFTWPVEVSSTPPESTDVIWVNPDEPAGAASDWALRAEAAAATLEDVGGLHVDTSAGVKVSVGKTVIHYDSGWRSLTRDNIRDGIVSGEVHIRRTLDALYLLFINAVLEPGSGSIAIIGGLPQSWRPSSNYRDAGQVGLASSGFVRQWVQHYGPTITWLAWQRVSNGDHGNDRPEDGLSGMLTIPPRSDDPLPTTLIGNPV